jgi:hypothetical protein
MKHIEFQIKKILFGQYYLVSNYAHVFCWNLKNSNKDRNSLLLEVKNEKELFI